MKFSDKLGYLRYLVDKRGMKPVYLIIGLTYDCNSFCRTCFNWELLRKNKEHELSLDELKQTFSSLGDLLFVVMSGGEPFLRRDLPDVCEALATINHVKQITIPTGAIASDLIAKSVEATLQRCPDTQIVVNLSIDHIGEKHDWIRGVPGNYDGFLKFVKMYSRRMELAVLEQETQVRPCHAGLVSGVLDARGEVRMCELREAVGNVRDTNYDFTKLWFNEAADKQRVAIRAKECHCTHSCFMSSSLVFDVRTWGAYFASTVVSFLSSSRRGQAPLPVRTGEAPVLH